MHPRILFQHADYGLRAPMIIPRTIGRISEEGLKHDGPTSLQEFRVG